MKVNANHKGENAEKYHIIEKETNRRGYTRLMPRCGTGLHGYDEDNVRELDDEEVQRLLDADKLCLTCARLKGLLDDEAEA